LRNVPPDQSEPRDMIDEVMDLPFVGEGVSRFQRMAGPSCFASLVIFLLLIVLFRRWIHLPWVGMVVLLIVIWVSVLSVMVRFRNPDPDANIRPRKRVERQ
jgi:hypothetical protein